MIINDINEYLSSHLREYLTDEFAFSSYNPPNTMYYVSNNVDEILLTLSHHALKMWHRSLSLLKRNTDPAKACTINVTYSDYSDILSRNYFYKARTELIESRLIYKTTDWNLYVINVSYANKLYKPKLDIME